MSASEAHTPDHDTRFPGESAEYRRAREELLKAEVELRAKIEAVAAQRRALPLGGEAREDYGFDELVGEEQRSVRLSELFADGKDTLFIYSFMFNPDESGRPLATPCPACTSIIDALDGQAQHVTQRINFAVSAKAPIAQFRAHARSRGWRHARLLSSANSNYNRDYGADAEAGGQNPMATVFVRRGGRIHHFWSSELFYAEAPPGQHRRHVDFMWPLWNMFDHTPDGRGDDFALRLNYG